jgi:hypothetical protein
MAYKDPEQQRKAQQESYERHAEKVIQRSAQRRIENREWVSSLKDKPCLDCGGSFPPYVMDFHHRDPAAKVHKISWMITNRGRQTVLEEIAKCDLICANCHRIREHR